MEVAQVGRGIARQLEKAAREDGLQYSEVESWLPPSTLIEVTCLAHDLGHPPFGHGGEIALNYMMREHGGFESNGQTLRLLAQLEAHTEGHGLDMTRRTLLGVLKYPVPYSQVCRTCLPPQADRLEVKVDDWKPPKCFLDSETDVVKWLLSPFLTTDRDTFQFIEPPARTKHAKPMERSLDVSIMEIADDIAYGVHDLEDAITLHLIKREEVEACMDALDPDWANQVKIVESTKDTVLDQLFGTGAERKRTIGGFVHAFVISVAVECRDAYSHPLLKYRAVLSPPAKTFLNELKELVIRRVIKSPQVQTLEYRGQQLVMGLFAAIASDPERLMKESFQKDWKESGSDIDRMRIVCDYIAGMTDLYATRMYERLFVPRQGTVFEPF